MKNKLIIETINNMKLDNIKKFNSVYCFQDDADNFNKNTGKIEMTEKFLFAYLCRICLLYKLSENDVELFIKWYLEKGHDKLIELISQICNKNIDVTRLKKFFLRYDILLEQTIYEKNVDGLLDLLISIPNEVDHSFKLCVMK
jgi:hypothetical protein